MYIWAYMAAAPNNSKQKIIQFLKRSSTFKNWCVDSIKLAHLVGSATSLPLGGVIVVIVLVVGDVVCIVVVVVVFVVVVVVVGVVVVVVVVVVVGVVVVVVVVAVGQQRWPQQATHQ